MKTIWKPKFKIGDTVYLEDRKINIIGVNIYYKFYLCLSDNSIILISDIGEKCCTLITKGNIKYLKG